MNNIILLFGVVLCLVAVNARHFADRGDEVVENEEETLRRPNEHNVPSRHRKRRWQMNYGYDYQPPSYHYPNRRDDINTQEVLQHISKLLEEISAYIRRPPPPPPPPQPIYIPYPMFLNYPQLQSAPCKPNHNKTGEKLPETPNRININDMDPNQNWGLVVSNENDYDDGSDGSRPISFEPIVPKQLMKRPPPKVEHGSVQASVEAQAATEAPRFQESLPSFAASMPVPVPTMCNAAILSCCGTSNDLSQRKQCFSNIGCSSTFAEGITCSAESIQRALESFRIAYSPIN